MIKYLRDIIYTLIYKLFYWIFLAYTYINEYFSPKGIKLISIYKITNNYSEYEDVSNKMNMKLILPMEYMECGCFAITYQKDAFTYKRIFENITPDQISSFLEIDRQAPRGNTILSAFNNDEDVSELLKEYSGPKQDFYNDESLRLKHLQVLHGIDKLDIITSKLDEYTVDDPDTIIHIDKIKNT